MHAGLLMLAAGNSRGKYRTLPVEVGVPKYGRITEHPRKDMT